jgi:hypothetical protein
MEFTCVETREAAAEFALGILSQRQRRLVAAHLQRCEFCRREVAATTDIAKRLLDLIPGTEPPLGFDSYVMAQVSPRRRTLPR